MFSFFENILSFLEAIVSLIGNLISGIVHFVTFLTTGVPAVLGLSLYMPGLISGAVMLTIGIALVTRLFGGAGGS